MSSNIHVDDIGTQLVIEVWDGDQLVNLSTAIAMTIQLRKPDGTLLSKNASLYTDGTDGMMSYSSLAGDFDVAGSYTIQGIVVLIQGTFHTSTSMFQVKNNI